MKDLQVLEEQQRESHKLLQAARETKQRKEGQRATLERQLGDLKYKDGQIRIELKRHREILAAGQRQLSTARSEADKAGIDLRNFDEYVLVKVRKYATIILLSCLTAPPLLLTPSWHTFSFFSVLVTEKWKMDHSK